jgi:DNA-binding beta-propeller fold protein YncE
VDRVFGRDPLSSNDRGAGLLKRPTDFAADPTGDRVYVVNAGHDRIEVFREGRYLTRWGGTAGAAASAFGFRGTTSVLADVSGSRPQDKEVVAGGIACDHDGFVYVADTFNGRIQKYAP